MYTITLSDGTKIENLDLSGNNFLSTTEHPESEFAGKLAKVTITDPDGNAETCENLAYVLPAQSDDGIFRFVLRQKSPLELFMEEMASKTAALETDNASLKEQNQTLTDCLLEMSETVYA